mgnify:FL=1
MAIETAGQQKYADLTAKKNQITTDRNDCLDQSSVPGIDLLV